MRIAVIIPAYNEEESIEKCLKSIKKQTYKDYEIIVVNAESTDKTAEIAAKYADRIITAKPGPRAGKKPRSKEHRRRDSSLHRRRHRSNRKLA